MQTPSVGRIVLVTVEPTRNNGSDVAPAVITRVWSDTLINVRALPDGYGTEVPAFTSVRLFATREELDVARESKRAEWEAVGNSGSPIPNGAYWPPRV